MTNKKEGILLTTTFILFILFGLSLLRVVQLESVHSKDYQDEIVDKRNEKVERGETVPVIATADETHLLNWNTAQLKNITLNLTDKTFAKHDYIYDEAEKVIQEIENFFGQSLNHSIPVFIHSGESYLLAHNYANYNFKIGYFGSLTNEVIVINVDDFFLTERADLRAIFAHEMTHAFIHHIYGFNSIEDDWIHEGLAEFVSIYIVDYSDIYSEYYMGLMGSIQDNLIYLFEDLEYYDIYNDLADIKVFKDIEQYEDYFLYESIFYFLYDQFGEWKLLEFIEQYSQLETSEQAEKTDKIFQSIFQSSEEELVEQWKQYYEFVDFTD